MKKMLIIAYIFISILFAQNQSQIDSINFVLNQLPNNSQMAVAFINDQNVSYYGAIKENGHIKQIDNYKSVLKLGL